MNIKMYKDYKLEIALEIFILFILLLVIYFGNIRIGNIIDGTFVAAVLSVPVAIVSYIGSKKVIKIKLKKIYITKNWIELFNY